MNALVVAFKTGQTDEMLVSSVKAFHVLVVVWETSIGTQRTNNVTIFHAERGRVCSGRF
jgi:hypothetical protein